jgi:hypothetical protein
MLAAIFNLNGHVGYVHVWVINLSVSNLIVIVLMLVVFVAALLIPFPGSRSARRRS